MIGQVDAPCRPLFHPEQIDKRIIKIDFGGKEKGRKSGGGRPLAEYVAHTWIFELATPTRSERVKTKSIEDGEKGGEGGAGICEV